MESYSSSQGMSCKCIKFKEKKERYSSFELLRIISMLFIVICHFATHGNFSFGSQTLSIPKFWWYFIEMGGNFGVDVFVLISGYFLVKSKYEQFCIKRIFRFWAQVFFYSVLLLVIFLITGVESFSIKSVIKSIFPIIFDRWWFASTYFVLYIIHPFLNILLNKIDKEKYQTLLMLLILIWCIIPTFTFTSFQSNNLLWFITLYCIAGYIRIFGVNDKYTTKQYFYYWLIFSLLRYASSVIIIILGTRNSLLSNHSLDFYGTQSALTVLSALCFFLLFRSINIGYHKWINVIASASFGVYLIHDNEFVRSYLWKTLFHNAKYQNSLFLIPYSLCVACFVYIVCTVIDLIRQATIEKVVLTCIDRNEMMFNKLEKLIPVCKKKFDHGDE